MRIFVAVILLAASGLAAGQRLLEFRDDLRFSSTEVDAVAARTFDARLRALTQAGSLPDPALMTRMQRIFPRLLDAAAYEHPDAARISWDLHACTQCDENAMALPGGKVLVSADFVARLALTDDELAYLLAHEIAHVLAEHTREFATAARYFMDNGLARYYWDIERELGENVRVLLRMAPVSERQELDADYIGYILGARAGFAPEAMLTLLQKQSGGVSLLRTHPADAERLSQALAMLESARRLVAGSRPAAAQ